MNPLRVINADDFYGRDAFEKAYSFLTTECTDKTWSIIGYELPKTLSDHGTVNRGVCRVDQQGNLTAIAERLNISMQDGKIFCDDGLEPTELPMDIQSVHEFLVFFSVCFPLYRGVVQYLS